MATVQIPIPIDPNGNVSTSPVHVRHGYKVYWVAEDPTQTWFIYFDTPFTDHGIFTDPGNNGESNRLKVRKRIGMYSYTVSSSSDPTLSRTKHIFTGGGGIIIDN
jgi:hypothetical protein